MIRPFWFPWNPQPPTMYTQEFSALEMIGGLQAKLNEVIQKVNELEVEIDKLKNA